MDIEQILTDLLKWVDENKEYQGEFECGYDHQSGFEYIDSDVLKDKIQSLIKK